jgi:hypothetical protein
MYVQHHLAIAKAPRYVIAFLFMLICMIWSLAVAGPAKRSLRIFSSALFCIWISYQVIGTVLFITGNSSFAREEKNSSREVVNAARERNLTSVLLYGDLFFGYKGQKLSMYAENKIVFSSADTERYQQNAQYTETDRNRGYLTNAEYKTSLENTLQELGVEFDVNKISKYYLFSNLRHRQQVVMRTVPSEEIQPLPPVNEKGVNGWMSLFDRNQDTTPVVESIVGKTLFYDTGKIRNLCGVWMFTSQNPFTGKWDRPWHFEVYVSENGDQYDKVFSSLPHTGNGFHAGPLVYIGGPWGKVEGIFSPVQGRYVKIVLPEKSPSLITELFIFETDGSLRKEFPDDIKKIIKFINDEDIDFVFADRWMSAKLRESYQGTNRENVALPRFSTRYKNRSLDYFISPEKGQAVLCDASVADECENALVREYGNSIILSRLDLHNYSLLSFAASEGFLELRNRSALLWNGHFPMQTKDIDLLARRLHTYGLPVWGPDFTKTSGIYHDFWTNGEGKFHDLDYRIQPGKDQELVLYTNGWRPDSEMSSLQLTILVNRKFPLKFKEKNGKAYIFMLPEQLNRLESMEIRSTTFVPSNRDARKLGIDIKRIEIQ